MKHPTVHYLWKTADLYILDLLLVKFLKFPSLEFGGLIIKFQAEKQRYLIYSWSDKGFKVTNVNWTSHALYLRRK